MKLEDAMKAAYKKYRIRGKPRFDGRYQYLAGCATPVKKKRGSE